MLYLLRSFDTHLNANNKLDLHRVLCRVQITAPLAISVKLVIGAREITVVNSAAEIVVYIYIIYGNES